MNHDVAVVLTQPRYAPAPFDPETDPLRAALGALFEGLGMDPENPFRDWIREDSRVVLKPNWVRHHNPLGFDLDSLVTHASLLRHVVDLVAVGLRGRGRIVVGDAPLQSCDFQQLTEATGVAEVLRQARRRHPGVEILLEDWRLTLIEGFDEFGEVGRTANQSLRADYEELKQKNYRLVDLGTGSFLEDIAEYAERFRVTCYKPSLMAAHHRPGRHEYLVSKRIFEADLLINLPKMKTHIKAGLTGALKNLVGINGHKEYLPHHIRGSYLEGGDCYYASSRVRAWHDRAYDHVWEHFMEMGRWRRRAWLKTLGALRKLSELTSGDSAEAGSWSGNETIWRTTLDLNHILHFSPDSPPHVLSILDGIVAGEKEGPVTPTPRPTGILIAGENPAYVDAVMGRLMGYNLSRIPTVYHALNHRSSRFAGPGPKEFRAVCRLDGDGIQRLPLASLPNLGFAKPRHWQRAHVPPPAKNTGLR